MATDMKDIQALRVKIGMLRGGQAPRETKQLAEYMLDLCDYIESLKVRIEQLESTQEKPLAP